MDEKHASRETPWTRDAWGASPASLACVCVFCLVVFLSPKLGPTAFSKINHKQKLEEFQATLSAVVDRVLVRFPSLKTFPLVPDFNSELSPPANMVNVPLQKICAKKVR